MMNWINALTEAAAGIAPAAEMAPAANTGLVALPLFTKGLLTTVMGLLGVFLVLALFFIMIKLMQHIGTKQDA